MQPSDLTCAYVGGRWLEGERRFPVEDPATGERLAEVADLGAQDARAAVEAAAAAFPAWARRTAQERSVVLLRWRDLILRHQEEIARLMTAEQGKPLAEARGEVGFGASFIEWFAEEAKRAYGEVIPTTHVARRYLTLRQPVGVVAAITPWNFPVAMLTRKVAPALAAGCTVVVKPAPETPLCALALARLAEEAGVPAGVLNVVATSRAAEVGQVLCESHEVRALSFTGSTAVGKQLYRQCADTMKKLGLELGGNAPVVVFEDADLDLALEGAMVSKFRNAGQTCVCANRILVQRSVCDAFAARLAERAGALRVGPGAEEGVAIGPLINAAAVGKVRRLVEEALSQGAAAKAGGAPDARGGLFFQPTVLTGVTPQMAIFREEVFGPVAALISFESEEEAVALANDTSAGLAAYVFTRDLGRSFRMAEALDYGIVSINEPLPSTPVAPFGGMKESGLGREGGRQGLEEFLETKYVCIGVA